MQKSLPMAPFQFIKCFCQNVASTECSGTVEFVQKSRPLALLVVYQVGGALGGGGQNHHHRYRILDIIHDIYHTSHTSRSHTICLILQPFRMSHIIV